MIVVKGYKLNGDWNKSSFGCIATAMKDGKKYFLKLYDQYKLPRNDGTLSESFKNKLVNEFNAFKDYRVKINKELAKLAGSGGNIILPTDWFVDDINYIEATEFVEHLIEDEEILELTLDEKLLVMKTAAAALFNIHRKKVVHSDLKRTNILAAKNYMGNIVAKIIDFDRSYFENDIRIEDLGGDQSFMAPELAEAFSHEFDDESLKYLTTKADIFSLGLVFHDYLVTEKYVDDKGKSRIKGLHPKITGLTGKLKEREDKGKTVYCCEAMLSEDARLIVSSKIKDKYLRHLIAAMLQPNPNDRPTAFEVLEALKNKKVLDLKSPYVLVEGESAEAPAAGALTGYCEPWAEHDITIDNDLLKDKGFVSSSQVKINDTKFYALVKPDGTKRVFKKEQLIMLGMASKGASSKKASEVSTTDDTTATAVTTATTGVTAASATVVKTSDTPASDIKIYEDGSMWESEADYKFDTDTITGRGFRQVAKAEKNGIKGYVLIKASGGKQFVSATILKTSNLIIKK